MKNKYIDLIQQTFDFPQEEFRVEKGNLFFHDVCLMDVIREYGTPLKLTYLPRIRTQIERARGYFRSAMDKHGYKGSYRYCYCTKSSHFSFVLSEVLASGAHLETSSAFDINIVEKLAEDGRLPDDRYIICNGFKRAQYIANIQRLLNNGFRNVIPVLDNIEEIGHLCDGLNAPVQVGIRIASEEEPKFDFYTSRLGVRYNQILDFYKEQIEPNPQVQLKMLHFFINTGISDTAYYWNELLKCVEIYCDLRKTCPTLDSLNIGGGFPIKGSLGFDYDYDYMCEEIVAQIKGFCESHHVPEPDLFTEFGTYTVGESGAAIYSILGQKQQNDREVWDMIDSSFITTLPDTYALKHRFVLLAINNWEDRYERVFLGGLTCDSMDFYNAEMHTNAIFLPELKEGEPQYIGFFHTGAYQESVGGYGGLQHCLIPAPKHLVIDSDGEGNTSIRVFAEEQKVSSMLKILGYDAEEGA